MTTKSECASLHSRRRCNDGGARRWHDGTHVGRVRTAEREKSGSILFLWEGREVEGSALFIRAPFGSEILTSLAVAHAEVVDEELVQQPAQVGKLLTALAK